MQSVPTMEENRTKSVFSRSLSSPMTVSLHFSTIADSLLEYLAHIRRLVRCMCLITELYALNKKNIMCLTASCT